MAATSRKADTRRAPAGDSDNYAHYVSDAQDRLYRYLGKNPRSLCGLVLDVTEDAPYPTAGAPLCPACVIEDAAG